MPRLLVTGSVVAAATAFRIGSSWTQLLMVRTGPLVRLAVHAAAGGVHAGRAEAELRDELVALARESAEASWRELRRGVDDFDALTRAAEDGIERSSRRPYRVKS
jgi:hypothetical protein